MFNLKTMGTMVDQPFNINCWRATLVFVSQKNTLVTIDGIPADFLVEQTGTGLQQRIELGGCYLHGRPVNIKHDLRITQDAVEPFNALLILQDFIDDGK